MITRDGRFAIFPNYIERYCKQFIFYDLFRGERKLVLFINLIRSYYLRKVPITPNFSYSSWFQREKLLGDNHLLISTDDGWSLLKIDYKS